MFGNVLLYDTCWDFRSLAISYSACRLCDNSQWDEHLIPICLNFVVEISDDFVACFVFPQQFEKFSHACDVALTKLGRPCVKSVALVLVWENF